MRRFRTHLLVTAGTLVVGALIGCGGNGTSSFGTTGSTAGTYDPNNRNSNVNNPNGAPIAGSPATTMPGNEILFAEFGDDGTTLERLSSDGKHASALTKLPGGQPAYAQDPTATHVAFVADKGAGLGVYYNTSTSPDNATSLCQSNFKSVGSIQFAPGGEDVLYTAETATQPFAVFFASTTGKMVKRLDDGDDATIAPNGKFVAYAKTVSGHSSIFVTGIDGKGSHEVSHSKGQDILPQWSKDGGKIFFTSDRDGTFGVYEISAKGGTARRLATGGTTYGGTPSPDGKKFAFSRISKSAEDNGLFVARADGTLAHKVSDTPAATGVMYWTTPSVAVGKSANHPGAPALSISPRAKALLQLPDAPAPKKVEPPKAEEKKAESTAPPADGKKPTDGKG